ncbi:MAG TPA: PAS domain S-box protein [Rubrivivax sp.]
MSTYKLLWLGFGAMALVLMATLLPQVAQVRSVQQQVQVLSSGDAVRSASASDLAINTMGYALALREHLDSGNALARQVAAQRAEAVRHNLDAYMARATTAAQREHAARFEADWRALEAGGRRLLGSAQRPPAPAELLDFDNRRRALQTLLDERLQPDARASLEARQNTALAALRTNLALALLLMVLGIFTAGLTGLLVGRRIVATGRQLDANTEALRVTLASIGDAVISTGLDGRVVSLNPVAQTLTGWSQADALGQPLDRVFRIVDEDSREAAQNPALRALQERQVVGLPHATLLIARDGIERAVDDSAAPILSSDGEAIGAVLVFRDITSRRLQEQRVLANERRMSELIDLLPCAVFTTDEQGRLRHFNSAAVAFSGEVPQLGSDCWYRQWTLYRADGTPLPAAENPLAMVLEQGSAPRGMELVLRRPDGTHLWFVAYPTPRFDDAGQRSGVLHMLLDITERKEADAALRLSELRYRRLFESAKDGILVLDAKSERITDANPAISDLLGYPPSQLVGKALWQIGLFATEEAGRAAVAQLQRERYVRFDDLPLRTRDGRSLDVEFVSNVYGLAPNLVIQCSVRDISERKRSTEALHELNRRKNEFLAMLAHELRNPLAPIRVGLEVIRRAGGDAGALQAATETVDRQVTHLVRLVDDLLDMSRIDRGTIELRRERIDLVATLGMAIEAARPQCDKLQHRFTVTLPEHPIPVDADATRLVQVLGNLLGNACKFTPPGGHIELSVEVDPAQSGMGDEAVIRVRDSGIGIAPDQLSRIFEMFVQVDSSLERSAGGLGIGLTLVKTLVERHGGSVQAASTGAGGGSVFTVRLPVLAADTHAAAEPAPAEPAPGARPRRILVVDDNRDAAESLTLLLQLSGHLTQAAFDGFEALEALPAFQPDTVLLDIGLPRLNGYEVARRLRQAPGGERILLIALTGWGQEEDRQRTREAGFDVHLVKPVDPAALSRLLESSAMP